MLSFFQFPTLMPNALVNGTQYPLLSQIPMRSEIKTEDGTFVPEFRKVEGQVGMMQVHASGKVRLRIGEIWFDVCALEDLKRWAAPVLTPDPSGQIAPSAQTRFVQSIFVLDAETGKQCRLGDASYRYMVSPDIDRLLEKL